MIEIEAADRADCQTILDLQKLCYRQEADIYGDYSIPPLTQTLEEIIREFEHCTVLKAVNSEKEIIGSVRAIYRDSTSSIGRLIVHPGYQKRGIGTRLMTEIEKRMVNANRHELFTGERSEENIRLYQKLGYAIFKTETLNERVNLVYMEKQAEPRQM